MARDPHPAVPRAGRDDDVILPIIYSGLVGSPVDEITLMPDEALDLAACLLMEARSAIVRRRSKGALPPAGVQRVEDLIWCDVHGGVHGETGDPHCTGLVECGSVSWRPLWMPADEV